MSYEGYVDLNGLKVFKEFQDIHNNNTFAPLEHPHPQYLTEHPSVEIVSNDTGNVSPKFGDTVTIVNNIEKDSYGHVTKISLQTVTIPDSITVTDGEEEVVISLTTLVSMVSYLQSEIEKIKQTVFFKTNVDDEANTLELESSDGLKVIGEELAITTDLVSTSGETIIFNEL